MANDLVSGIPLTFEYFCATAQLEPAEIEKLRPFAGSGERPLRTWVQLLADKIGLRLPRDPLTPVTSDSSGGRDGLDGVGIRSIGIDERWHLLVTLTTGEVLDAGALPGGGGAALPSGEGFLERHLSILQMTPLLVDESADGGSVSLTTLFPGSDFKLPAQES